MGELGGWFGVGSGVVCSFELWAGSFDVVCVLVVVIWFSVVVCALSGLL